MLVIHVVHSHVTEDQSSVKRKVIKFCLNGKKEEVLLESLVWTQIKKGGLLLASVSSGILYTHLQPFIPYLVLLCASVGTRQAADSLRPPCNP